MACAAAWALCVAWAACAWFGLRGTAPAAAVLVALAAPLLAPAAATPLVLVAGTTAGFAATGAFLALAAWWAGRRPGAPAADGPWVVPCVLGAAFAFAVWAASGWSLLPHGRSGDAGLHLAFADWIMREGTIPPLDRPTPIGAMAGQAAGVYLSVAACAQMTGLDALHALWPHTLLVQGLTVAASAWLAGAVAARSGAAAAPASAIAGLLVALGWFTWDGFLAYTFLLSNAAVAAALLAAGITFALAADARASAAAWLVLVVVQAALTAIYPHWGALTVALLALLTLAGGRGRADRRWLGWCACIAAGSLAWFAAFVLPRFAQASILLNNEGGVGGAWRMHLLWWAPPVALLAAWLAGVRGAWRQEVLLLPIAVLGLAAVFAAMLVATGTGSWYMVQKTAFYLGFPALAVCAAQCAALPWPRWRLLALVVPALGVGIRTPLRMLPPAPAVDAGLIACARAAGDAPTRWPEAMLTRFVCEVLAGYPNASRLPRGIMAVGEPGGMDAARQAVVPVGEGDGAGVLFSSGGWKLIRLP